MAPATVERMGEKHVTDAAQHAVLTLPVDASGVVIGAPGTGKTTTLLARAERMLASGEVAPDALLVLTPTRQSATALRDDLALRGGGVTPGPLARSLVSFAYQLVRAAAVQAGEAPPQLLTAGDQDRIIAELLAGDEQDAAAGVAERWPEHLPAGVRSSRAFRTELRALMADCTERGVDPDELAEIGAATGRDAWVAAAAFTRDYRYAVGGMRSAHRDAAELVREAAALLASAPPGEAAAAVLGPPAGLRVVLVDDAQELTRGGLMLLRALRRRGVAVLAFGDPDIGSGGFRGASPELFAQLCDALGTVHVLDRPHRGVPALTRTVRRITAAIGAAGRVDHRRAPDDGLDDAGSDDAGSDDAARGETAATSEAPGEAAVGAPPLRTIVAASPFEEVDRIARVLREWRLLEDIPWSQMAVIAHDTRTVADLQVELAAREVPTRAVGVTRPLGAERVVRELLGIVELGIADPAQWDPDEVTAALVTPFGGLDAVGLRRLRARLRHAELADGGSRPARELIAEALAHPATLLLADSPEARAAQRLAVTLEKLRREHARGADVHALLWLVWDGARDRQGTRLETAWRRASAARGAAAAEIDHALDALVALFDAAKRFVERAPNESATPFLRRILDSDVPEDTLTAPDRLDVVAVLTPAAALGTEFEGIVIAGVQEGVWPNVRLRGGLLEGWRLGDDVDAARSLPGTGEHTPPGVLDRRRAALGDELRLLVRALSRARSRVVVTAVDDDDLTPSGLLALFPEPDEPGTAWALEAEHPLTLRGLVARHRRTLTTIRSGLARERAAGQLALLTDAAVPGAAPAEWFGIAPPSSTGPLRDPDRGPVSVSPSKLTQFDDCPLDWAIRALGGDTRSWSAGAGVILHAAMEEVPSGDLDAIRAIVDARWGELDFEAEWLSRKEHAWAHVLAARLHGYLDRFHSEGGHTIGAEARFRLAVELGERAPDDDPRHGDPDAADAEVEPAVPMVRVVDPDAGAPPVRTAMLSGAIDRVEVYPPGRGEDIPLDPDRPEGERVIIVDLKTGRSESRVSDDKVVDDPQLAAYQLAFLEGLVPGADPSANAGARLVVLSKTTKARPDYRIARQVPMDEEARARFLRRIVDTAWGMASPHFDAPVDAHCASSRFGVCALHTVRAVSAS